MSTPGWRATSTLWSAMRRPTPRGHRRRGERSGPYAMRDESARITRLPPPLLHRGHALFLDFDGTLVAIAAAPNLVQVPAELPGLLSALSVMLDRAIAVVSGRPVDELAQMVAPFLGALAGQHGLERRGACGAVIRCPAEPALGRIRMALARFAARHEGVALEDKGRSLALHYRQAPALAPAVKALVRRIADACDGALTFIDGKMVAELIRERPARDARSPHFLPSRRFAAARRCLSATTPPMRLGSPWSTNGAAPRSMSAMARPPRTTASPMSATFSLGLPGASPVSPLDLETEAALRAASSRSYSLVFAAAWCRGATAAYSAREAADTRCPQLRVEIGSHSFLIRTARNAALVRSSASYPCFRGRSVAPPRDLHHHPG